jgi:hypothetical protein
VQAFKKRCVRALCAAVLLALAIPTQAQKPSDDDNEVDPSQVIVTPTYLILILEHCGRGVVGCDNVDFTVVNRATGQSLRAKGASTARSCMGSREPCEWLGWEFRSGRATYVINRKLVLQLTQSNQPTIEEQGTDLSDLEFFAKKWRECRLTTRCSGP